MALSRRLLLKALAAAPMLSVIPSLARAQGMPPKFYVHLCTGHGAIWNQNIAGWIEMESPFCPSGVEGLLELSEFAERRTPLDSARGDRLR